MAIADELNVAMRRLTPEQRQYFQAVIEKHQRVISSRYERLVIAELAAQMRHGQTPYRPIDGQSRKLKDIAAQRLREKGVLVPLVDDEDLYQLL